MQLREPVYAGKQDVEEKKAGTGRVIRYRLFVAERVGFEPTVPRKRYNTLAGCRFRPLSHLSGREQIYRCSGLKSIFVDHINMRQVPTLLGVVQTIPKHK